MLCRSIMGMLLTLLTGLPSLMRRHDFSQKLLSNRLNIVCFGAAARLPHSGVWGPSVESHLDLWLSTQARNGAELVDWRFSIQNWPWLYYLGKIQVVWSEPAAASWHPFYPSPPPLLYNPPGTATWNLRCGQIGSQHACGHIGGAQLSSGAWGLRSFSYRS